MSAVPQKPIATVTLLDAASQRVAVEASGPSVAYIEGKSTAVADPDEIMPDWLELVAKAVNLGMMSGASHLPCASRATVTRNEIQTSGTANLWEIELEQIDPGLFLVMLNVLRARELESIALRTIEATLPAKAVRVENLRYPAPYRPFPFEVVRLPALREAKDRSLQIVFTQSPPDEVRSAAMDALNLWSTIVILAGYASLDAKLSQTTPDFPYWNDTATLVQPFEFFDSDESCFDAMVNWAFLTHHSGHHIKTVIIQ